MTVVAQIFSVRQLSDAQLRWAGGLSRRGGGTLGGQFFLSASFAPLSRRPYQSTRGHSEGQHFFSAFGDLWTCWHVDVAALPLVRCCSATAGALLNLTFWLNILIDSLASQTLGGSSNPRESSIPITKSVQAYVKETKILFKTGYANRKTWIWTELCVNTLKYKRQFHSAINN